MEKDARIIHNPTNIAELALIEELMVFLYNGNVFIHHKKPLSKELVNKLSNDSIRKVEILHYKDNELSYADYKKGKWKSRKKSKSKTILLFEMSNNNTKKFIQQIINKGYSSEKCGIWILGYVDELKDLILSFFDALFIFDTSSHEFEILKRYIALTDATIKKTLKNPNFNSTSEENVLFFLNHKTKKNDPSLNTNPKALSLNGEFKAYENPETISQVILNYAYIKKINKKRKITSTNYVEGDVNDGNIAGNDIEDAKCVEPPNPPSRKK